MRERSAARYSFICLRRLRSTAMWVIRWLSTSSEFLAVLVRRRFLRPVAAAVAGGASACPTPPASISPRPPDWFPCGAAAVPAAISSSWNHPCGGCIDEPSAAPQSPPSKPTIPSPPPNRLFQAPPPAPAMAQRPKRPAATRESTAVSNAMP
jgi:hypothetical protein